MKLLMSSRPEILAAFSNWAANNRSRNKTAGFHAEFPLLR